MDKLGYGITIGVILLFVVIVGGQYPIIQSGNYVVPIFVSTIFIATLFLAYIYHPVSYTLSPSVLTIQRPGKDAIYSVNDFISAELVAPGQMKYTIRTFGVGGLFGYYGKFANSVFGSMTWYASRRDNMILLTTVEGKKIVITPDESERFLMEFQRLRQK